MADLLPDERQAWLRAALERYERPLLCYVARMVRDDEAARDIVQDAFAWLCREDHAALDGRVAEWLYTVCRRRAIDVHRKEKRMTPLTAEIAAAAEGFEPLPTVRVEQNESGAALLRLVESLPDRQQEALRLKFQGGLAYKQIAAVMETSVRNVGVLIHTAIKQLRTQLVPADDGRAERTTS